MKKIRLHHYKDSKCSVSNICLALKNSLCDEIARNEAFNEIHKQLNINWPVGIFYGFWTMKFDWGQLLMLPNVQQSVKRELVKKGQTDALLLLPDTTGPDADPFPTNVIGPGLAFIPSRTAKDYDWFQIMPPPLFDIMVDFGVFEIPPGSIRDMIDELLDFIKNNCIQDFWGLVGATALGTAIGAAISAATEGQGGSSSSGGVTGVTVNLNCVGNCNIAIHTGEGDIEQENDPVIHDWLRLDIINEAFTQMTQNTNPSNLVEVFSTERVGDAQKSYPMFIQDF